MSGRSNTNCIFDGGVDTGIIASVAPKGTPKENRKGKAKGNNINNRDSPSWFFNRVVDKEGPFLS